LSASDPLTPCTYMRDHTTEIHTYMHIIYMRDATLHHTHAHVDPNDITSRRQFVQLGVGAEPLVDALGRADGRLHPGVAQVC
jgi:hypothetical protein